MKNNSLQQFGQIYISQVRDQTISEILSLIRGEMKDAKSAEIHKKISSLDSETTEILRLLAIHTVNLTMHNILFMFESNDESFKIYDNKNNNLTDMSDGLSGELYSKEGWIEKFSKFK